MADPLTALGVAANIAQFVDLGCRVTRTIVEVYHSAEGLTAQNVELEAAARELRDLSLRLKQDIGPASPNADISYLLNKSIDASDSLLKELASLKFSGGSSHLEARVAKLVTALRTIRRKRRVQRLQLRVEKIRGHLLLRLQALLVEQSRAMLTSLDGLYDSAEKTQDWHEAHSTTLDSMGRDLENLLAAHDSWADAHGAMREFTKQLVAFVDQTRNHETISIILRSLHFKQLRLRQSEIPVAHRMTFQWMFDADGGAEFRSWLRGPGGGIFWITGKPGSGKSTLMKFLLGHHRTAELLQQWLQDDRPLLRVSHFFWAMGDRLQKSHEGLLRTLLFQILLAYPELIPAACPERYSTPYRCLDSWTVGELSESFQRLTAVERLPARIFIFIDGLDEYSGEPTQIAKAVKGMASCPDIKICCASRPWVEFETAFESAEGRIRIHHLTKEDIRLYVRDCFEEDDHYKALCRQHPLEAQGLVNSVTSRAEGVFFWVFLVVRSLLRGLGRDDDIATLHRRLEELPTDLDEFFMKMLQSLEPVYMEKARVVLNCLLIADSSLPVAVFTAMDSLNDMLLALNDSGFWPDSSPRLSDSRSRFRVLLPASDPGSDARDGPVRELYYPAYRDAENAFSGARVSLSPRCGDIIQKKSKQLLHYCRDLAQCWDSHSESPTSLQVGFIHRTVVDFLRTPVAQSILATTHPSDYFYFILARSFLHLAEEYCDQSFETLTDSVRLVLKLVATAQSPRLCLLLLKLDAFLHWLIHNHPQCFWLLGIPERVLPSIPYCATGICLGRSPQAFVLPMVASRLGLVDYLRLIPEDAIPCIMDKDVFWYVTFFQALQPALDLRGEADQNFEAARSQEINVEGLEYLVKLARRSSRGLIPFARQYPIPKDDLRVLTGSPNDSEWLASTGDSRRIKAVLGFVALLFSTAETAWNPTHTSVPGRDPSRSLWDHFLAFLASGRVRPDNAFAACKVLLGSLALEGAERRISVRHMAMSLGAATGDPNGPCGAEDMVRFFERIFGQPRARVLGELFESSVLRKITRGVH